MTLPNKKHKQVQKNKGRRTKKIKPPPVIRFTVDDPVNDIFDDEIYDEEAAIPKEKINEEEKYEKPW